VKHWNKKKLDPIYYDHGTHYFILWGKLIEEHHNNIYT
jgi:hypothetical protein